MKKPYSILFIMPLAAALLTGCSKNADEGPVSENRTITFQVETSGTEDGGILGGTKASFFVDDNIFKWEGGDKMNITSLTQIGGRNFINVPFTVSAASYPAQKATLTTTLTDAADQPISKPSIVFGFYPYQSGTIFEAYGISYNYDGMSMPGDLYVEGGKIKDLPLFLITEANADGSLKAGSAFRPLHSVVSVPLKTATGNAKLLSVKVETSEYPSAGIFSARFGDTFNSLYLNPRGNYRMDLTTHYQDDITLNNATATNVMFVLPIPQGTYNTWNNPLSITFVTDQGDFPMTTKGGLEIGRGLKLLVPETTLGGASPSPAKQVMKAASAPNMVSNFWSI